jgi:hypothetical protein
MKTIFAFAAAIATLAGASAASAHVTTGQWEWRSQPAVGPRSTGPSRVRVWVADHATRAADCDCGMMKVTAADCMAMPGTRGGQSAG